MGALVQRPRLCGGAGGEGGRARRLLRARLGTPASGRPPRDQTWSASRVVLDLRERRSDPALVRRKPRRALEQRLGLCRERRSRGVSD